MTNEQFIETISPYARRVGAEYNVLPSLIMAQAIHESGWGKSRLVQEGCNLFGIKGEYHGRSVTLKTWEHLDGKDVTVDAAFRCYPSWYESMTDLALLYTNGLKRESHNRYAAVVGERNYRHAAHAVADAGYATDPAYASRLIATIERHRLTRFDTDKVEEHTYTVQSGDTLSHIAARFNTTVAEIVQINGIADPNQIAVGQVLVIE